MIMAFYGAINGNVANNDLWHLPETENKNKLLAFFLHNLKSEFYRPKSDQKFFIKNP